MLGPPYLPDAEGLKQNSPHLHGSPVFRKKFGFYSIDMNYITVYVHAQSLFQRIWEYFPINPSLLGGW